MLRFRFPIFVRHQTSVVRLSPCLRGTPSRERKRKIKFTLGSKSIFDVLKKVWSSTRSEGSAETCEIQIHNHRQLNIWPVFGSRWLNMRYALPSKKCLTSLKISPSQSRKVFLLTFLRQEMQIQYDFLQNRTQYERCPIYTVWDGVKETHYVTSLVIAQHTSRGVRSLHLVF